MNSTNNNPNNSRGKLKSLDRAEALMKEIRDCKTERRMEEDCQSAASCVEDLDWIWGHEGERGSQEEGKSVVAVEVNRKRNRLRVFQEMTAALKDEVAF